MKNYVTVTIVGFVMGIAALTAFAQAPAAPAPAAATAAADTLDETEKLLVEVLSVRAQLANNQCEQLDSMKQFVATRAEVLRRIEAKHPGKTLDASGKLVAKTPQK